ncbi:MAG: MFS transporter [Firmicutes bacterium]|nr:MFS transporter [Bacillota bacterium]
MCSTKVLHIAVEGVVPLKSSFYGRVGFLSLVHGLDHAFLMFSSPLFILILRDLGLDYAAVGALVSLAYFTYGIGALPAGFLSDRFGHKWTITAAIALASMGALVGSLPGSYGTLAVSFFLLGLGASLYHPPAMSLLAHISTPENRGIAMGLHGVGSNLVMVAAPALAGGIATLFHWRAAFLFWGLAGTAAAALFWRLFESTGSPESADPSPLAGLAPILQDRELVHTLLIIFLLSGIQGFIWSGTFAYIATYLQDVRGMTVAVSGILAGVQYGVGALGHLVGGYMADRSSRVLPVLIGTTGALIGFGLILLPSPAALLVGIFILGFSLFVKQPAMNTLLADAVPQEVHGRLYGVFFIITNTIGALAPMFGGLIIGRFSFTAFFLLCSAIVLSAYPLILLMRSALREASPRTP